MATLEELHQAVFKIGRANPKGRQGASSYLKRLDYSVLQQCIHCGMCLPACPTYDETKLERNSPRGRIALMRQIADGHLEVTQVFGRELYFLPRLPNMRDGMPGWGQIQPNVRIRTR
jgi:ferredoxin